MNRSVLWLAMVACVAALGCEGRKQAPRSPAQSPPSVQLPTGAGDRPVGHGLWIWITDRTVAASLSLPKGGDSRLLRIERPATLPKGRPWLVPDRSAAFNELLTRARKVLKPPDEQVPAFVHADRGVEMHHLLRVLEIVNLSDPGSGTARWAPHLVLTSSTGKSALRLFLGPRFFTGSKEQLSEMSKPGLPMLADLMFTWGPDGLTAWAGPRPSGQPPFTSFMVEVKRTGSNGHAHKMAVGLPAVVPVPELFALSNARGACPIVRDADPARYPEAVKKMSTRACELIGAPMATAFSPPPRARLEELAQMIVAAREARRCRGPVALTVGTTPSDKPNPCARSISIDRLKAHLETAPRVSPEEWMKRAAASHERKTWLGIHPAQGPDGTWVVRTFPHSPASKAGIHQGDLITAIDGKAIPLFSQLTEQLIHTKPGTRRAIRVMRSGRALTLNVTLESRPQR